MPAPTGIEVGIDDERGTRVPPPRREASLRVALRRAVAVLEAEAADDDLATLLDDERIARRMLPSARSATRHGIHEPDAADSKPRIP